MTTKEKINLIEEALELEPDTLNENTELDSLVEYDSMGKLSLIVLADEEFEKKLTGEQINEFKKVQDVLNFFDV
jgi:acyl carrier protein